MAVLSSWQKSPRGGIRVAHRARQTTLNRTVAVNMVLAGKRTSRAAVNRLLTANPKIGGIFCCGA